MDEWPVGEVTIGLCLAPGLACCHTSLGVRGLLSVKFPLNFLIQWLGSVETWPPLVLSWLRVRGGCNVLLLEWDEIRNKSQIQFSVNALTWTAWGCRAVLLVLGFSFAFRIFFFSSAANSSLSFLFFLAAFAFANIFVRLSSSAICQTRELLRRTEIPKYKSKYILKLTSLTCSNFTNFSYFRKKNILLLFYLD